jgi:SOS-response transcriptional repressor LexA
MSQAQLAEACGWASQSRIGNYERDTREPSVDDVITMASVLRISPAIILGVDSEKDLAAPVEKSASERERESMSNVEMTLQPTRFFSYPEISWVQAGSAKEAIEVGNVALCPQHLSDVWAGENAFWLKVVGNSMSSAIGNSFPEGSLILVGPDIEPRPGQFVVARMIDSNEATFKQLIRDAGEIYLKPLNPSYPTKPMDNHWEIVGTVVDGKMPKSIFF